MGLICVPSYETTTGVNADVLFKVLGCPCHALSCRAVAQDRINTPLQWGLVVTLLAFGLCLSVCLYVCLSVCQSVCMGVDMCGSRTVLFRL